MVLVGVKLLTSTERNILLYETRRCIYQIHTHTESEVLLVEVEAEVFTLSLDDFSQSWSSTVKYMNFPFLLL